MRYLTVVPALPATRPGLRTRGRNGSIAYTRGVGASDAETRPGVFITLEGPDGSGKSSLLRRLGAHLAAAGCDVVATREPGSTPLGDQVRRLVLDTEPKIDRTGLTDALLFAASRAQHVADVIRPALARGAIVVCDRYLDSSMAYQGAGSGLPMDELAAVQRFATGGRREDHDDRHHHGEDRAVEAELGGAEVPGADLHEHGGRREEESGDEHPGRGHGRVAL